MNRFFQITACVLFAFFGSAFHALGQNIPSIETGLSIETYVNDYLLGEGVEVFNITYSGGASQLGVLNGAEEVFSIGEGLVMSSDAAGALVCDLTFCEDCLGLGEDQDLLNVANSVPDLIGQSFTVNSVNDIASLEFDFMVEGDTLAFNFAFSSGEYSSYINTQFNDVFAFFLSGPGIEGPYATKAAFTKSIPNPDVLLIPTKTASSASPTCSFFWVNSARRVHKSLHPCYA